MISVFFSALLAVLLLASNIVSAYSYLLKSTRAFDGERLYIALANWLLYGSRVTFMIALVLAAYLFEVLGFEREIFLSFFLGNALSVGFVFMMLTSARTRSGISFLVTPFLWIVDRSAKKPEIKIPSGLAPTYTTTAFSSFIASVLIGLAFVSPFLLSSFFKDYKMLATLSSQVLNFLATILLLSIVEPRVFAELDSRKSDVGDVCSAGFGVVFSKVLAYLTLAMVGLFGLVYS